MEPYRGHTALHVALVLKGQTGTRGGIVEGLACDGPKGHVYISWLPRQGWRECSLLMQMQRLDTTMNANIFCFALLWNLKPLRRRPLQGHP